MNLPIDNEKISLANDGRRWIADEFGSPKEQ
jgi:hypothetical protein